MSNDAASVLSVARGEIGYCRWNDPEQGTKYGRWYAQKTGSSYFASNGVPYCAMFVSWVFDKAGATCSGLPGAGCTTLLRQASSRVVAARTAKPGDIVLFDWDGSGDADHVGIVEVNNGSYLTTIEGNTSRGGSGSQSNGGWVARRTRSWSAVRAIVRPTYSGAAKPSTTTVSTAGGKLTVDGYWGKSTTKRAQELLHCVADGEVWGQYSGNKSKLPGCTTGWKWSANPSGSPLVKALQTRWGVSPDGIMGPSTVNAMIRRYGNGVCDGRLDAPSAAIKGFQKSLNAGKI